MKKILLLLTLLTFSLVSFSQKKYNIPHLKQTAFKEFGNRNYDEALELFFLLQHIDTNKAVNYHYLIGMCYISTENFKEKALEHLLKGSKHKSKTFVIDYYIGRAYLIHGHFDKALYHLGKYKDKIDSLEASGFKFKKELVEDENIKIHFEKSSEDVTKYLLICRNNYFKNS